MIWLREHPYDILLPLIISRWKPQPVAPMNFKKMGKIPLFFNHREKWDSTHKIYFRQPYFQCATTELKIYPYIPLY